MLRGGASLTPSQTRAGLEYKKATPSRRLASMRGPIPEWDALVQTLATARAKPDAQVSTSRRSEKLQEG